MSNTIDIAKFHQLVHEKYLKSGYHPSGDLIIWNYTDHTQFTKHWTPETLIARGLITTRTGQIVARPFPKFFNYDELPISKQRLLNDMKFIATKKLDGSLGILYFYQGKPYIASRGSFNSDQAKVANELLLTYDLSNLNFHHTYIFEIIYPENKIILDYGNRKELILLGIVDINTGNDVEINSIDWNWPVVETIVDKSLSELSEADIDNEEGYVIRFLPDNFRIKLKFKKYIILHRPPKNSTARDVWYRLANNKSFDTLLKNMADEYYDSIKEWKIKLMNEFEKIDSYVLEQISLFEHMTDKKELAKKVRKLDHGNIILFALNKKDYKKLIWKKIKPAANELLMS